MPYVETSAYCGTARNLQFRGHVIHGIRIVSMQEQTYFTFGEYMSYIPYVFHALILIKATCNIYLSDIYLFAFYLKLNFQIS